MRTCQSLTPTVVLLLLLTPSTAQDASSDGNEVADLFDTHLAQLVVAPLPGLDVPQRKIVVEPLLSYSDPARKYLGGGVWRIGAGGRPVGLVTLELWPKEPGIGTLHYEMISFNNGPLRVTSPAGVDWHPSQSAIEMKPLADDGTPADSPARRLLQMKQIARTFSATELYEGDRSVLRMLPRPIDRYDDSPAGIVDGAIFTFAYGTNPELLLVLECSADEWRYGVSRMSWAELTVERDGEQVHRFPRINATAPDDPYESQRHEVRLP